MTDANTPVHESRGPSRGYRWPPFEPGNAAALKHGADSERCWKPIADRLTMEVLEAAPWSRVQRHARQMHASIASRYDLQHEVVVAGEASEHWPQLL